MAETNIFAVPSVEGTSADRVERGVFGERIGNGRQVTQTVTASAFDLLRIGIASPQDIRSWSRGEVKKPETINYRTFKPERDGLFCERIFGPTKDMECSCGKFKKSKFKGVICDRCGVEVTRSKVRRVRMGHIELAAPVAHLWYVKGVPSPMALLLDMSPRFLERVLYFSHWIVTAADQAKISKNVERIRDAVMEALTEIDQSRDLERKRNLDIYEDLRQRQEEGDETVSPDDVAKQRRLAEDVSGDAYAEERKKELQDALGLLNELEPKRLLEDREYRGLQRLSDVLHSKMGGEFNDLYHAGMGATAVQRLLEVIDLEAESRTLKKQVQETPSGAKRGRLIKRLEIVEAFRKSKNRPEWMIMEVIPVMPPELRPMVQLDGGRFATSDLNDLYRRIINRNNRLKRITEIKAPESIINHEKRLLQESVDALIDNTRRQRPVTGSSGRPLKSLSDMLKGKEGRFRKNLLGKRVDYSGRSVIVVGPQLRLDQCGLPKEMALELFKPFVMKRLVQKGFTSNIKTARRMVDRLKPEVWDALEEVITEHPVLLNRAPTLHRLGIQAFEPKLVEGKAIQIHPLVCPAFNADFDGDQMAVHVPLFAPAQAEARILMMSTSNLFSPRDGAPAMTPGNDMVLGCFYLTMLQRGAKNPTLVTAEEARELPLFGNSVDAIRSYDEGRHTLHELICVRHPKGTIIEEGHGARLVTTIGRLLFNEILPEAVQFANVLADKKTISGLVMKTYETMGNEACVKLLDDVKNLGFRYATKSGMSISMGDFRVESKREDIIARTELTVKRVNDAYRDDPYSMTAQERERSVLQAWVKATQDVSNDVSKAMDPFNPLSLMSQSGATGKVKQMMQIVGMRGLMQDPSGRLIEDLPVKSNFRRGLDLHEYFVSTHGARKGLADTALRTADAGYLTRRLVDVSQDVIIRAQDCGSDDGIYVKEVYESDEMTSMDSRSMVGRRLADPILHPQTKEVLYPYETYVSEKVFADLKNYEWGKNNRARIHMPLETLAERLSGRIVLEDILHPETGEVLVATGENVNRALADKVEKAGVRRVKIRSILTCKLGKGVCANCYGTDLATNGEVEIGEAVGIIAAQSIGEPGTQLTMRTFHMGGVAQGQSLTGVSRGKEARRQALIELRGDIAKGNFQMQGTATEQKREIQRYLKVLEASVGGLLRVVELFEARKPKGEAITTTVDGRVVAIIGGGRTDVMQGIDLVMDLERARYGVRKVLVQTTIPMERRDDILGQRSANAIYAPDAYEDGLVVKGAKPLVPALGDLTDKMLDLLERNEVKSVVVQREFAVPHRGNLDVRVGQEVALGDTLTKGPLWPQDVLQWRGLKGIAEYLVQEVQKVYKAQGINIHDKHIEVIVRQMLRKRRVKETGDTELMPGKLVDASTLEAHNQRAIDAGLNTATADFVLLGITEAALATESFLSAASFQKTTKVLTEAATHGKEDMLEGLKENVIIGRLIPAGTGLRRREAITVDEDAEALEYARANAELMRAEELRARPAPRTPVDVDDVFNIPGLDTGASALELAEAGMSIEDASSALSILDDESEPSVGDLGDSENDLLGGEDLLSSFSDDE
ncbi:DNA-directed RNA polymerase subunit beta' [Abditibacteriota bacterium]|nr:DNA-directed RNA polymerase subunit beta' [Abditibacteriota bacterium]